MNGPDFVELTIRIGQSGFGEGAFGAGGFAIGDIGNLDDEVNSFTTWTEETE
jgi:hypothetical protein